MTGRAASKANISAARFVRVDMSGLKWSIPSSATAKTIAVILCAATLHGRTVFVRVSNCK